MHLYIISRVACVRMAWWRWCSDDDGAGKHDKWAFDVVDSSISPNRDWRLEPLRSWPVCQSRFTWSPCQESLERSELALNFGTPELWAPLPLFINFPFVTMLSLLLILIKMFFSLYKNNSDHDTFSYIPTTTLLLYDSFFPERTSRADCSV